jgi:hypothetical protein
MRPGPQLTGLPYPAIIHTQFTLVLWLLMAKQMDRRIHCHFGSTSRAQASSNFETGKTPKTKPELIFRLSLFHVERCSWYCNLFIIWQPETQWRYVLLSPYSALLPCSPPSHITGRSISRPHRHACHERSSTSKPAESTALLLRHSQPHSCIQARYWGSIQSPGHLAGLQLVGIATPLVLQRKKLPREDLAPPRSTKGEDI